MAPISTVIKRPLPISDDYQLASIFIDEPPANAKSVFRNLRNYLAGQVVGSTRDDVLLDEILKCLFCKLYLEVKEIAPLHSDEVVAVANFYRSTFSKVRTEYSEIFDEEAELLLSPEAIFHVVNKLSFRMLDADRDPIGDAFEVFAGTESRARSGQFFTPRNATDLLVSAINPQPGEKILDPACGAGGFLASTVRHFYKKGMSREEMAEATGQFFGVDKDRYLTNLARLHVSLLTGGHPNIVVADSLSQKTEDGRELAELIPTNDYDVIFTNPPFGANIVAASPTVLQNFCLSKKWKFDKRLAEWMPTDEVKQQVPPQVLFVERCISLLKEGGRLGIVIPESLLSNKGHRYVMEYLRQNAEIEAVIGMPEALFKTSGKGGTHTKTCLLVARKIIQKRSTGSMIFMAEAKWCGHDSRAREIPHDDLPKIGDQFNKFKMGQLNETATLGFGIRQEEIIDNILCPRYYNPEMLKELSSLSETHSLLTFGKLVEEGILSLQTGDEVGKLVYGTGDIPFIRTSDISNWEIKVDPKQCIDDETFYCLKNKQDVQTGDILMVKDGTYLIGTCAIVTDYDRKIVYQSHIYKIRVSANKHGICPYLLLAVLSSPIVQKQIRTKQFTQDIIDSLGERINELVLPIPKSEKHKKKVADMVKKSVDGRIKARELSREARMAVLASSY